MSNAAPVRMRLGAETPPTLFIVLADPDDHEVDALVSRQAIEEKCINPFMVINEIESGLSHHSLLNDENTKKRFRELLAVVKEEYEDIIKGGEAIGRRWVDPDAVPAVSRRITKLAFRNRFTDLEKLALYTAAESSVQLRVYLDDLSAAEFVDLDCPATVAGVQALEQAGIIGAGRAAEILG